MKKSLSLLVILSFAITLFAQQTSVNAAKTLAITHVAVVDVARGVIKRDMTVIIAGERIVVVGRNCRIKIPRRARVINVAGKFLIPGLWEMHAHLGDEDFDKTTYLRLFIVNGVTASA